MALAATIGTYREAVATCIICLMSQSSNEAPMQLPPPIEQTPVTMNPGEQALAGAENVSVPERTSQPGLAMPPTIPLPVPPLMPISPTQNSVGATTSVPVPVLATIDDGDLIEKEWVHKAKQIVERNRDDPYKQSEELTVFKADYIKKRYNKTVKLNK